MSVERKLITELDLKILPGNKSPLKQKKQFKGKAS